MAACHLHFYFHFSCLTFLSNLSSDWSAPNRVGATELCGNEYRFSILRVGVFACGDVTVLAVYFPSWYAIFIYVFICSISSFLIIIILLSVFCVVRRDGRCCINMASLWFCVLALLLRAMAMTNHFSKEHVICKYPVTFHFRAL